MIKRVQRAGLLALAILSLNSAELTAQEVWRDSSKSIDERTDDLISRLTIDEKLGFFSSDIPAIDRLGIGKYGWYTEALHGAMGWKCTSFPQNNAMGSTWNRELMFDVASAISDEVRTLAVDGTKEAMIFSPTINMSRDPRWGRNEECYSEDPYHMAEIAKMYVRGMQGTDPDYFKTVCTIKHYVANNVEHNRERVFSHISERDLREYYLPAYKECIVEERAAGVMSALNGLNGVPCSADEWLLTTVLRDEWGFEGYVIADWNAVGGLYENMKVVASNAEGAAMALKAGCDQECFRPVASKMVHGLREALERGLITEDDIDVSLRRLIRLRFMVGGFYQDPAYPYYNVPQSVRESDEHRALALKAAEESVVLLKNEENILPLSKEEIKSIAVVGPFAPTCWLGIYSGFPQSRISPLEGIKSYFDGEVLFEQGCAITHEDDSLDMSKAIDIAKRADVVVAFVGNDEKTATENRDRLTLRLPGRQEELLDKLCEVSDKVIVVIVPSGATIIGDATDNAEAILCGWANGQEQGTAIANLLFGDANPSGKLNTTWFASDDDVTNKHDYNIRNNRTYMYFDGEPLYPFGYGLSYTTFAYSDIALQSKKLKHGQTLKLSATVTNSGSVDGAEVLQLYIKDNASSDAEATKMLKGFEKVYLKAGESQVVDFELPYDAFSHWDDSSKSFVVSSGRYDIMIGASSSDIRLTQSVKVEGGKVAEKSVRTMDYSDYCADPRYKGKIYTSADVASAEGQMSQSNGGRWVEYDVLFKDPGYYVGNWSVDVAYSSKVPAQRISIWIGGVEVSGKELQVSDNGQVQITIPKPDYGVSTKVRVKMDSDQVEVKSIGVSCDGVEPVIYDKPIKTNR
ncbi:MAG: glycoside hydrolase family 3 C-terminal domain-containing protein [Rikenellaceae bacterium]